jgi:hypothetical protein
MLFWKDKLSIDFPEYVLRNPTDTNNLYDYRLEYSLIKVSVSMIEDFMEAVSADDSIFNANELWITSEVCIDKNVICIPDIVSVSGVPNIINIHFTIGRFTPLKLSRLYYEIDNKFVSNDVSRNEMVKYLSSILYHYPHIGIEDEYGYPYLYKDLDCIYEGYYPGYEEAVEYYHKIGGNQ